MNRTDKPRRAGVETPVALALVLVCFGATAPGQGQDAAPDPEPVFLDRSKAIRLVVTQVKPEYPPLARINYIQGHVQLQVLVTREGRIGGAHVVLGHPFLAASALKAIRRWVFRPFMTKSGPSAFSTTVGMNFSLRPKRFDHYHYPFQAERDLEWQIRPPEVLEQPPVPTPIASVRLRVLVSDEGRVMDADPLFGLPSYFEAARKTVESWTFRPARWGTLPVPWYLNVDIPVETLPAHEGAGDPGGK